MNESVGELRVRESDDTSPSSHKWYAIDTLSVRYFAHPTIGYYASNSCVAIYSRRGQLSKDLKTSP